jgi:hypothetical protein
MRKGRINVRFICVKYGISPERARFREESRQKKNIRAFIHRDNRRISSRTLFVPFMSASVNRA